MDIFEIFQLNYVYGWNIRLAPYLSFIITFLNSCENLEYHSMSNNYDKININ